MAYAAWTATTSYAVGDIVRATTVQDFGLVFQCTTAGTSGSTQPAWPTLIDSTTTDGTVTWIAISAVYEDLSVLEPNAIIELFQLQLDATLHGSSDIYYFHNGVNAAVTGNIIWNGQTYVRLPIEATGFDYSSTGSLPRPRLAVSNIGSNITAILLSVNLVTAGNDLGGAKLVRIRTLKKYLDGEATADPHAKMPDEIWYVDRKSNENRAVVEFELASKFDLAGVFLPRRQIIANVCQWQYRGAECGYTGNSYWNTQDERVGTLALDACGKRISSCKLRFESANFTGTVNLGSNLLTLDSSVGYGPGTPITGFGIPSSTTVSSVSGSGLVVTMSANATATSTGTKTGTIQSNRTQLIVSDTTGLATGMTVTGPNISAGTTITGIAGTTLTLSQQANVTYTLSTTRSARPFGGARLQLLLGNTAGLSVGMAVMGDGLPANYSATITGIGLGSVFLSVVIGTSFSYSAYSFYTINPYTSGTYTFSGSNVYTFVVSGSNELPFGSFPGAGLLR